RVLTLTERQKVGHDLEQKYGLDTAYFDPDLPVVDNDNGATFVTGNSATMNGNLTYTGALPAVVEVYWGTSDGGTSPFAWENTNSFGTSSIGPLSSNMPGLSPNTAYYYRFSATNSNGRVWADSSESFVTDLDITLFTNRLKITFCGYDRTEALSNFPVLVRLDTNIHNFSYATFASSSGGDLRFTDDDMTTPLNFEIEQWNPSGVSYIWVQVPQFVSNGCIFAYWGAANTNPPPTSSDGSAWESSYLGVWHLGEPNAQDSSFPQNNGTPVGATVVNDVGLVGTAQRVDNSYIDIANEQNFDITTDITVSTWIRVDGGWRESWQAFVSKRGEGGQGWQLRRLNNTDVGSFVLRGTTGADDPAGAVNLNDGQWHHIVGVYDGAQRTMYVDGEVDIQLAETGAITLTTANDSVKIGARDNGASRHRGMIDETRIMAAVRSPNWIWASYMTIVSNDVLSCVTQVENPQSPLVANTGCATGITT
ncbi:MAG: DUF2341 domain-containing protein, partial [Verrucomicrobiota bacterium]